MKYENRIDEFNGNESSPLEFFGNNTTACLMLTFNLNARDEGRFEIAEICAVVTRTLPNLISHGKGVIVHQVETRMLPERAILGRFGRLGIHFKRCNCGTIF